MKKQIFVFGHDETANGVHPMTISHSAVRGEVNSWQYEYLATILNFLALCLLASNVKSRSTTYRSKPVRDVDRAGSLSFTSWTSRIVGPSTTT